jgi:hypothetical protein
MGMIKDVLFLYSRKELIYRKMEKKGMSGLKQRA